MGRKQHKFPRIRPEDWAQVDGIVRQLRAAADAVGSPATALLHGAALATSASPSLAHHRVVTAINQMRKRGMTVIELDARGNEETVHYRLVRYFFRTPAWADERFGPVETIQRTAVGPSGKTVTLLCEDGEWRRTNRWDATPRRIPSKGGVPVTSRVIAGERLDGQLVTEVACNELCVGATGSKCECSCGGANHGTGATVTRFVPRSPAEQRKLLTLFGGSP